MSTYLIQFGIYTMAMVGAIFLCLMVFKKTMINSRNNNNNNELAIENTLNLSQRKTLYVIKAGDEKFLIAADAERTTFLSKLNDNNEKPLNITSTNLSEKTFESKEDSRKIDYSDVMSSLKKDKSPVLKEMLKKLNSTTIYKESV